MRWEHLKSGLDLPVGYHGVTWFEVDLQAYTIESPVPQALRNFIGEVAHLARDCNIPERHGMAYMRVIDAGQPENYMKRHVDNEDGGVRFSTAVSSDDVPVNLVFDTQLPNGEIAVFTTEPHHVKVQPARPGQRTAVFFATLYRSRAEAELYVTHNTTDYTHAVLPSLEDTR